MANVTQRISWSYRDAKGWKKIYKYWVTGDAADAGFFTDMDTVVGTLESAISGLTNAAEQTRPPFIGASQQRPLSYGTAAEYVANWMEARMMFATDAGTRAVYGIGAPKVAIFDTDRITVLNDGTQALVVAYVNAVKTGSGTAFVSTQDGQPFTKFVGGILKIGVQPKRFSEPIKSSHLVAGEGE